MTANVDIYLKVLIVAKPFSTAGSGVLVRSCDVSRGAMFAPVRWLYRISPLSGEDFFFRSVGLIFTVVAR